MNLRKDHYHISSLSCGRRYPPHVNIEMFPALSIPQFVPFSIEAGGVWGPAARKFFRECLALADDDRDIDLYHWSSTRFSAVWRDTLSVLVARGRAQVSVAAAVADWPKRIRDMRYVDHEDCDGTD